MIKYLLLALYLLSPLAPLALFFSAPGGELAKGLNAVAMAAGIVAYVWLCWQFLVASRLRPIERLVGQDRMIRFHIYMGAVALAGAALHASLTPELRGNWLQGSLGGLSGNLFLYLSLVSVFFLSDFLLARIPYAIRCRGFLLGLIPAGRKLALYIHRALALALAAACLHIALVPGDGLVAFRAVVVAYWAVSMAAFAHHSLLRKWRLALKPFSVKEVRPESEGVWTVALQPAAGCAPLSFSPGQFLYLTPIKSRLPREEHPFSISSSPRADLCVTIKALGDFTSAIGGLECGDQILVEGPYGRFSHRHARPGVELVFIAGGVGVTPFLSMLHALAHEDPERRITLLWGAKQEQDLFRVDEIETLAEELPNMAFHPVLSRQKNFKGLKGHIDRHLLENLLGHRPAEGPGGADREFFLCAPSKVIDSIVVDLRQMGVPKNRIHHENFSF